ncbi:MAG TPA: STAS domain-containing protein [Terriglobales bacterium]|nr:STAS domain-containing protein [Terriglobales bacterium]
MATIAEWVKMDANNLEQSLHEAREKLNCADRELVLDFAAIGRIGSNALIALEQLSASAQEKSVKLVLRGVTVEIYRVLQAAKLAKHFSFLP